MKRIMIVEDDKDMQEIYRVMFDRESNYSMAIFEDAEEALKHLREEKFDLVVLDIIMEPMTGDSFFVHARNDVKMRRIPIIVVSVLKKNTLEFLATLGNFHYLQKPITKTELFAKIDSILK